MSDPDYKAILLSLIASLTLCGNVGDVSDDASKALEMAGIVDDSDDFHGLGHVLHSLGVKTLYGTDPASDPCEVEDCPYYKEGA